MCTKMKICCGIDPNIVDVTNKNELKSSNAQESQMIGINVVDFEKTDTNLLRHQKIQEAPEVSSRNQNAFLTLNSLKTIEGLTERQVTRR